MLSSGILRSKREGMPSPVNNNDQNLLDSAASAFRGRVTPGSGFYDLLDSSITPSDAGGGQDFPPGSGEPDRMRHAGARMTLPATERLSRSVEFSLPQVGDLPPEPPTVRGRVG